MRIHRLAVLGALVLLTAATAVAQPAHDKDKDHGKPAGLPSAAASAAGSGSAGAPGRNRDGGGDQDKDKGDAAAGAKGSPLTGITESEAQRTRRLGRWKEQHDKVAAALKGRANALSKEQRDIIAQHNRVAARLQWILAWAENEKKPEVATRAQAALTKEDARFYAKLGDLAGKPGGSAAPAASSAPAAGSASGGAK